MIQIARKDQANEICDLLIRSITILCVEDHLNSKEVLEKWLANKTSQNCLAWINDKATPLLVAINNGKVQGVGKIDRTGYIHFCYVAPEAIGNGHGKELVSAMEDLAGEWGLNKITLESTKTALPFYEALGYHLTGTSWVFDQMNSYHMEKILVERDDS